jgi:hypothetical protein
MKLISGTREVEMTLPVFRMIEVGQISQMYGANHALFKQVKD